MLDIFLLPPKRGLPLACRYAPTNFQHLMWLALFASRCLGRSVLLHSTGALSGCLHFRSKVWLSLTFYQKCKLKSLQNSECLGLSHASHFITRISISVHHHVSIECFHWNLESLQIGQIFWRLRNHRHHLCVVLGPQKSNMVHPATNKRNNEKKQREMFGFSWVWLDVFLMWRFAMNIIYIMVEQRQNLHWQSQGRLFLKMRAFISFLTAAQFSKGYRTPERCRNKRNKAFFKRPTVACWCLILRTARRYSLFSCKKALNVRSTSDYSILRGTGTLWRVTITMFSS